MDGRHDDSQSLLPERFRTYLWMLAYASLVRDRLALDATDLVQQVLLDAQRRQARSRKRTEAEMAAWLRRILRDKLIDAAQGLEREKSAVPQRHPLEVTVEDYSARLESLPGTQPVSQSQGTVTMENMLRLSDALAGLPEDELRAVVLRHLCYLSLSEITERLQLSKESVAGLMHRGLKKLRMRLSI